MQMSLRWRAGGGVEEEYEEQGEEEEEEEGYVTDDSVDPDNMTYEASPVHSSAVFWLCKPPDAVRMVQVLCMCDGLCVPAQHLYHNTWALA